MGTPRNFSNTASGASLNGALAAGAVSALLNNFSNYPAAPFTATISRNSPDEEIVLVTAVTGSTATITRGFDGSSAQAHSAGATFEHTAVATDFREAQAHINATTGVHGLTSLPVGLDDTQTLTGKTIKALKALANASAAGVEVDNESGATGKLFRGLNAGVEKFFVDYQGNVTGASFTGATATLSGLLTGAAATLSGLLTANGGITVPTGKKITLVDAPATGTDGANKTYADARETTAKAYTDTRETAIRTYVDTQDAAFGRHLGSGTAYPASPIEGDTFRRTDQGYTARYDGTLWNPIGETAVFGKMWKINSASASISTGSAALTFNASRLAGGVTFATNKLALPLDGFYEVAIRSLVTGAVTGNTITSVARTRASVADLTVVTTGDPKLNATMDVGSFRAERIPLKAGDTLGGQFVVGGMSGAATAFGTDELGGVLISARWIGPLNGATPV